MVGEAYIRWAGTLGPPLTFVSLRECWSGVGCYFTPSFAWESSRSTFLLFILSTGSPCRVASFPCSICSILSTILLLLLGYLIRDPSLPKARILAFILHSHSPPPHHPMDFSAELRRGFVMSLRARSERLCSRQSTDEASQQSIFDWSSSRGLNSSRLGSHSRYLLVL